MLHENTQETYGKTIVVHNLHSRYKSLVVLLNRTDGEMVTNDLSHYEYY